MILKIVEGLLSTIHLMYNNHFKQTIGKIIEIPNLTEEDPRLVEKVRVLNFFRFLLFSRWWFFSSISVWIAKLVIYFYFSFLIQTLIWKSSKGDEESEYLCFLLCSGVLGISISMISRVGWLFWGLENIISSSSRCCVTGPSSANDNFDRSVSHSFIGIRFTWSMSRISKKTL